MIRPVIVPGPFGPEQVGIKDENGIRLFRTDDTRQEQSSEVSDIKLPPLPPDRSRRFYTIDQLGKPQKIEWLVEGWIPAGEVSMIYGPGDSYKSFLALHWGLEVSTDRDVVYIAGEGAHGLRTRIPAWLRHHDRKAREFSGFRVDEQPVTLDSEGDRANWLAEVEDELSRKPDWVIVDTLSMCFGGDENSPQEMNRLVRGLEDIRRVRDQRTAITVIHHTPVGKEMRERGTAALRNSTASTVRLSGKSGAGFSVLAENDRQKEWEKHPPTRVKLTKVEWAGVSSLAVSEFRDASSEVIARDDRKARTKK